MRAVQCPTCRGDRQVLAFVDGRDKNGRRFGRNGMVDCFTCAGTGSISAERAQWMEDGRVHMQQRKERGESIYAAAARLRLTVPALSAMEQGRADPAQLKKDDRDG